MLGSRGTQYGRLSRPLGIEELTDALSGEFVWLSPSKQEVKQICLNAVSATKRTQRGVSTDVLHNGTVEMTWADFPLSRRVITQKGEVPDGHTQKGMPIQSGGAISRRGGA